MSDIDDISKNLNTLKEAQKIGKDTSKIVTDIQKENNDAVQQAHKNRELEKKQKERMILNAEIAAFEKFKVEQEHKEMLQKMERDVTTRYGKEAWQRVQQLKQEISKANEEELKLIQKDKDKVNDLFWWILGIVSIVAYMFKVYKI
ncbi:MAG: hypothetical protein RL642_1254 [Bacteroidota bacterium]|jgi:hypothetical protein